MSDVFRRYRNKPVARNVFYYLTLHEQLICEIVLLNKLRMQFFVSKQSYQSHLNVLEGGLKAVLSGSVVKNRHCPLLKRMKKKKTTKRIIQTIS